MHTLWVLAIPTIVHSELLMSVSDTFYDPNYLSIGLAMSISHCCCVAAIVFLQFCSSRFFHFVYVYIFRLICIDFELCQQFFSFRWWLFFPPWFACCVAYVLRFRIAFVELNSRLSPRLFLQRSEHQISNQNHLHSFSLVARFYTLFSVQTSTKTTWCKRKPSTPSNRNENFRKYNLNRKVRHILSANLQQNLYTQFVCVLSSASMCI